MGKKHKETTEGETMSGLNGYDQWKTASPYDDEPDVIDEAERLLKHLPQTDEHELKIYWVIENLLKYIDENV